MFIPTSSGSVSRTILRQQIESEMTPVISIIGFSNSGKTTFLEKLIREMTRRKVSVFAVKHTHHSAVSSSPGTDSNKDTDRLKRAGAVEAVLIGPEWDEELGGGQRLRIDAIRRLAERHAPGVDFILIEGMKTGPALKIEVSRRVCGEGLASDPSQGLIAVVADYTPDISLPVFGLDDAEAVADFLLNRTESWNQ